MSDRLESCDLKASPEKPLHPKILRVYSGYLERAKHDPFGVVYALTGTRNPRLDQRTLDIFTEAGFTIVEGGQFNELNPNEFGILAGQKVTSKENLEEAVAESTHIAIPATLKPEQILTTPAAVLVKHRNSRRGEDKWLLETTEQKVRFLAYELLEENILKPSKWEHDLGRIFEEVKEGHFDGDWTGQWLKKYGGGGRILDCYRFQEYKPSLSPFNTSIRVWVDALGKIHGAVLMRSRNKKGQDYLPDDNHYELEPHFDERLGRSLTSSEVFFTNPKSPFYLKARDITSNSVRGGHVVYLNGERCTNETDAQVLVAHGINPEQPTLPNEIAGYSSTIGKLLREAYPIVGIDFLPSGETLFLEANTQPGFFPKAVGLPKGLSEVQQLLEMIRRVALSLS